MEKNFSCFYNTTDKSILEGIWKDSNTFFVFDTNVLLSLYSLQPESRNDFFRVLATIEDRIWIPFHVGLEFQRNRLNIIKKRRNHFKDLNNDIEKLVNTLKFDKKSFTTINNEFSLKKNYPSVQEKLDTILKEVTESFKEIEDTLNLRLNEVKAEVKSLDKDRIFVNSDDFVRKEIDKFFTETKVGKNTFDTQEKIDNLSKEGDFRYINKIPPGYLDEKEKGEEEFFFDGIRYKSKFGDLIIFKQIIEFAKENKVKNIIFISEDIKEDWRQIEEFEGTKILNARTELKNEIYKETSVENFFIYQIEEFMKKTNDYLNVNIENETLKNIKISLEADKRQTLLQEQHTHKALFEDMPNIQNVFEDHFEKKEVQNSLGRQGFSVEKLLEDYYKRQKLLEKKEVQNSLGRQGFSVEKLLKDYYKRQKLLEKQEFQNSLGRRGFNAEKLLEDYYKRQKLLEKQEFQNSLIKDKDMEDTQNIFEKDDKNDSDN